MALLQNTSVKEKEELLKAVDSLDKAKGMGDDQKSLSLGVTLLTVVGSTTLREAVNALGKSIRVDGTIK